MAKFVFSGDIIFLVGGFVIGWIVFKRPDWATNLINNLKSKIGL